MEKVLESLAIRWNNVLKSLSIKLPVKKVALTEEQVTEICEEIEHQWLHLLTTRAVFTNKHFPNSDEYESGGFYISRGIHFRVKILKRSLNFIRGAGGLSNWHNKNYVIRLYGILEKYQVLYSGRKAYNSELMELIYCLRPEVGAHGSGRRVKATDSDGKRKLRKATRLINKLFPQDNGKEYDVETVQDYWLPIDGVLEKMKYMSIEFVKSLRKD